MAIQKTFVTSQGFEASNAYYRIEKIDVVSKTEMTATVRAYRKKPEQDSVAFALTDFSTSLPFDVNGAGVFLQAYTALKTKPAFAGATDC
jgi:hypothetical protein